MNDKKSMLVSFALWQAELSKCKDKKTASLLVSADLMQIYSIGINGGPRSGLNCLCDKTSAKAKYTCAHSEMNCLVKNTVINDTPKIMICTKQPCQICATLIVNANTNINEVWFVEPYWDDTGLKILHDAGIKTIKFEKGTENDA